MQLNNCKITFKGEVSSAFDAEKVKQDTAILFKLDTIKLQKIFSGTKVTLKKDITHEQAQKYQDKLKSLGLIVYIEEDTMAFTILEDAPENLNAASPIYHPPASSQQGFSTGQGNQTSRHDYSSAHDSQIATHDSYYSSSKFDEIPECFSFDFDGRIGRLTFINYNILSALIFVFAGIIAAFNVFVGGILFVLALPIFLVLYFRITILRLHDINLTGWLCLLHFVPIVGFFFPFYLMIYPGTAKANNYGKPVEQGSIIGLVVYVICSFITVIMFINNY